ncbi:MAG TPA: iron-containing alcohol dehydrogenase [Bryobacteraceae bacterium]|nr:iron-containing alcohol dehydrogenase [Bryobacteraceae bacterium]
MIPFVHRSRTRLVFGPGTIHSVGQLARELGFRRTLIVADAGMEKAGHIATVLSALAGEGIESTPWSHFGANPDSSMVEQGRDFAASLGIDSIIGLGGGSSMDCAKAINIVLTNGGRIQDYWGHNKVPGPLLPMIGVPATTGTGSEAQSYALISDAATHVKMAIGDDKAAFAVAVLDPQVAHTQPSAVRAAAGYDAISHAVESFVTTKRNAVSVCFAREAWRLMDSAFSRFILQPDDISAIADMQLGAWFAGSAIEASMLGAAHALANPLTASYGIAHGQAIAAMLPHVVQWNAMPEYAELHPDLPARLREFAALADLRASLRDLNVDESSLAPLSLAAAQQWTGKCNPRPFDAEAALELYRCAY